MSYNTKDSPVLSALLIAGTYAIFGMLWILFSDSLVESLAASRAQLTLLQSIKGVAFVVISAIILYSVVYATFQRLTIRNHRLKSALQQAVLLHRISRHNIRNSCNVILGYLDLIKDQNDVVAPEQHSTIEKHTHNLLSLSEKSRYLRDFLDPTTGTVKELDIADIATEQVQVAREEFPSAIVTADIPDTALTTAHVHIGRAIGELIENAIKHNPAENPRVWVTVKSTADSVVLTIEDDGTGIPTVETRVFERREETPTEHSQGIGLWLVELTAEFSGGTMSFAESTHGGARVSLTFPTDSLSEKIKIGFLPVE